MLWYRRAARLGHPYSKARLARLYLNGDDDEDRKLALPLAKEASEGGEPFGSYLVGCCLECGIGTEKNLTEAKEWYEKAAKKNQEDALYRLALWKARGILTEKDPEHALKLCETALKHLEKAYGNDKLQEKLKELEKEIREEFRK